MKFNPVIIEAESNNHVNKISESQFCADLEVARRNFAIEKRLLEEKHCDDKNKRSMSNKTRQKMAEKRGKISAFSHVKVSCLQLICFQGVAMWVDFGSSSVKSDTFVIQDIENAEEIRETKLRLKSVFRKIMCTGER